MQDNCLNRFSNNTFTSLNVNANSDFQDDFDILLPVPVFAELGSTTLLANLKKNETIDNIEDFSITTAISDHIYKRKDEEVIDGWEPIAKRKGKISGFKSIAYKKIIILLLDTEVLPVRVQLPMICGCIWIICLNNIKLRANFTKKLQKNIRMLILR